MNTKNCKPVYFFTLVFMGLSFWACKQPGTVSTDDNPAEVTESSSLPDRIPPSLTHINFTISVEEVFPQVHRPALQSAAWARDGNKILLVGGRKEGFHGRTNLSRIYTTLESNDSLWVIDLDTGESWGGAVPASHLNQFSSTNMLFCQSGDTLYLAGGYGTESSGSTQLNSTVDRITGIRVSSMISKIMQGQAGPALQEEVLFSLQDTIAQVTGGEMEKINNTFYLVMGQNYTGRYTPGRTGSYTEAVRTFDIAFRNDKYTIAGKKVIKDDQMPTRLHRRDLNVVPAIRKGKKAMIAFGGVFTIDGQGWLNPVYLDLNDQQGLTISVDTFEQKMNNYNCATIPIYDPETQMMYTCFLGGISYQQYDPGTKEFVTGDQGIPLPFINTILTLAMPPNSAIIERIQIPPNEPVLPGYLGAEAVFVPLESMLYEGKILDFSKVRAGQNNLIGYMYGGIRATAPSSSSSNPTYASKAIYKVFLNPDK